MGILNIFDFLRGINIDPRLMIAMVGIGQFIKSLDKGEKWTEFYWIIPFGLSLIVATFLSTNVMEFLMNAFIYLGVNVCFYNLVWRVLVAFRDKIESGIKE